MELRMPRRSLAPLALLLLTLLPAAPLRALEGGSDQSHFFQVRKRQIELKEARTRLARTRELFDQGLVSRTELEQVESTVETVQLAYQEAVLALVSLQPRLSVRSAVKHQAPDGRKWVRLTVTNLSPTFDDSQFKLLANFEGADPIPASLRTRDVRDVFVALQEPGGSDAGTPPRGTTIALPYEVHIPHLGYGQSRVLDFQLLRDVGSVVVATSYKGQRGEVDVQLQQADTASAVTLASTQISQEADLGSQVTYDLRLERSTVDSRTFQLNVLNLPHQVSASFLDPETQARLSQINFPAGVTQKTLALRLFLPERGDAQVPVDRPLAFWAVAASPEQAAAFGSERLYEAEEIRRTRAGALRFELIPRGVGKVEVQAPSLFAEMTRGGTVETTLTVRNTGTRRLDNIQLTTEPPFNWQVEVTPSLVPSLAIGAEQRLAVRILPPADVAVGDYEVRIKTESSAYNRKVPAEEKIFRVSVEGRRSLWTTLALVGSLAGLVGGMVLFGVKLVRR
jgi:hypothetical protein